MVKSKYTKLFYIEKKKSSFIYQILPVIKYKGKKNSILTRTQRPWRERTIFVHYCFPSSWNTAWHVGDNNKHLLDKWMNNNENIPKWLGAINIKNIGPLHRKLTYTEGYEGRLEKVNNWILLGRIWESETVKLSIFPKIINLFNIVIQSMPQPLMLKKLKLNGSMRTYKTF